MPVVVSVAVECHCFRLSHHSFSQENHEAVQLRADDVNTVNDEHNTSKVEFMWHSCYDF